MATKTKTRKATTTDNGMVILPEYSPKDTDIKFTGGEPLFLEQPTDAVRQLALVQALSWYGRYMDRKVAKDAIVQFAESRGVTAADLKTLRSTHERDFNPSICWLARLGGRGLVHTEVELAKIGDHLKGLLALKTQETVPTVPAVEVVAEVKAAKPNVQEIMIARAREAAGEIEGLFDAYLTDGNPRPADLNVVGLLTERGIMAQHVGIILEVWTRRKAEFEAVQAGDDPQLKEGYSQYGKIAVRNLIKWCDSVINGLQSYSTVKKAAKAPRKRKPVPVERQVAKVKYLKAFKDDALKLDLVSVHPSKLVGATEAFLYDTAKRKLIYVVADSHAGTFAVKGTTLLGYDASASGVKTVRKPAETVKRLMSAGKPASRKVFNELTTVQVKWNGRLNDSVIILKAY